MSHPIVRILIGLVGLAVVALGIRQILGSEALPTREDAARSAREAAADLVPWSSTSRGISLRVPRGWEQEEPASGPLVLKIKTFRGVVNLNVLSEDVADGTMLFEYVNRNVEEALASMQQQQMKPRREHELDEKLVIGGDPGTQISMTYSMTDRELDAQVTQAYVIHGNRAYAITLTAPRDLHAEYQALFRAIVESVRFA
jgi:hypothetical protein